MQGMEEVATEQEGQGISRHALCTDSHLAALWKTDCTCLHIKYCTYSCSHSRTHSCPQSCTQICTHTLYIYVVALGPSLPPVAPTKEVWGDQGGLCSPAFLQFPINILRHPLCTTTTIFLQLPTTRLDLPIGLVIIVVTLREEICGEGQAVASP